MIDPMCTCGFEPETTLHYLLQCNLYSTQRLKLLKDTLKAFNDFKNKQKNVWSNAFLYVKVEVYLFNTLYIDIIHKY